MFTAKLLPSPDKYLNPILSGIRFSVIDKPILFEISNDEGLPPLLLSFNVCKDATKKPWEYVHALNPDNTYSATLFNPVIPGSGGLIEPYAALWTESKTDILGIMFWVDFIANSNSYRLSYEFFSDTFAHIKEAK